MSKILDVIDEIEEFIGSSKSSVMSKDKITIDRNHMFELLEDLRDSLPSEIEAYKKVIENRDAILANAKNEANAILVDAKRMTEQLVDEHEIMQKAYDNANLLIDDANLKASQIIDKANTEASSIRMSAFNYTDGILSSLEAIIGRSLEEASTRFGSYSEALRSNLEVVSSNRQELLKSMSNMENK